MIVPVNARYSMADIAEASGYSLPEISRRVTRRMSLGLLEPRERSRRGAPATFSYDEVKIILWPLMCAKKEAELRVAGPAAILQLRHQLQTDGFTIRAAASAVSDPDPEQRQTADPDA